MIICGLDCSSINIGYAYFKDDKLTQCGVLKSVDKDVNGRQFELFSKLYELFEQHKPDRVIMEQSFFSNNYKTSRAITEVIGNAKVVCQLFNIPFETVAVTQWKKATTGSGKINKNGIMEYVKKNFPVDNDIEQDTADSILICFYGVLNERKKLDVPERKNNRYPEKAGRKGRNTDSGTA